MESKGPGFGFMFKYSSPRILLFYLIKVLHMPPFGIVIGSPLPSVNMATTSGWLTSVTDQDGLQPPFSADINGER